MPRPTDIGSFGEAVWAELGFDSIVGDDRGLWTTLLFLGAISQAFQQLDELAHVDSVSTPGTIYPQWSKLMDVDRVPDEGLAWFGQFTGVVVDGGLSAADQRTQIKQHIGWYRGGADVMKANIQKYLTGTKTVEFIERDTSPYHFHVATYSDETPSSANVTSAIIASKPAGLQFTYTVSAGSPATADSYEQVYDRHASYQNVFDTEPTYEDLYINP